MNVQSMAHSFAHPRHWGQMYGDRPYFSHIVEVSTNFKNLFGHVEMNDYADQYDEHIAVCYLHDVIEDTDATLDDLRKEGFSGAIILAVDAITKREDETRPQYLDRVKNNEMALKVKIADTLANLQASTIEQNYPRISKYTRQLGELMLAL